MSFTTFVWCSVLAFALIAATIKLYKIKEGRTVPEKRNESHLVKLKVPLKRMGENGKRKNRKIIFSVFYFSSGSFHLMTGVNMQ